MSTQEIPSQADFRERTKTNDVPIARLIGFEAKDIADARATVVLAAGPQHANPVERCTAAFFATLPMPRWA
jgi:hypothetical protein